MKSHEEQIAAVIARHELHLQNEAEALAVKQREIEAAAVLEAEKLAPVKNSLDAINNQFGALVRRHDQLTESVARGSILLRQQEGFVAEHDAMVARIFNAPSNGLTPNPHDFWRQFEIRPELAHAAQFAPKLKSLLEQAQSDLAGIEQEIEAFAASARFKEA
jgi:hypothetical protein